VIREAFQDLKRLRQIAAIAARFGFADVLERTGLSQRVGGTDGVKPTEEAGKESSARRFRRMLAELGPTFVKFGQVLSTRGDLLPQEVIDELAVLQDRVPAAPFPHVQAQIKEAFGRDIETLFKEFAPEPMAAASMAQVHRAVTHEGHVVVVKVQRPGIAEQMRADLSVLHYLARLLEAVVEEAGLYSPTGIIEEFDRAIHEELDFLNEASNIRAFFKNHLQRPAMKIPKVYDELTGRTVLTMEFIDAPKLLSANLDEANQQTLAKTMLEGAFHQLFEDGLFHGDPHPGNLLVLPGPVLALLDFGLVGRVTRPMQDTLISLVLAIALKDAESVARLLYRIGTPDRRTSLVAFRADIDALLSTYLPGSLKQIDSKRLLRELLDLAVKYRIRVPKEYAILARAAVAIEGLLRSLWPDMPIGQTFLPYAKKLLAERYDPTHLEGGALKGLLRLQTVASELPLQLEQIMMDLEAGKFTVTLKAEQMADLNNNLRALAVVAFAGLCACGFIIGTFIAFSRYETTFFGLPVLGLLGIGATVFLLSTAVVRQAWGGFKKVSVSRLFNRKR
jgi:ubiquinone biosynthesis protein